VVNSFDIETFLDNNIHIPYCICYIIKKKNYNVYYKENIDIVYESILHIFKISKIKEVTIYIHNLDFDGLLILNSLSNQKKITFSVFMKKMNIYSITLILDKKKINFRCSFKILPVSLYNISKSFNIEEKMIFPYLFSTKKNLFYIGSVPDKSFFNTEEDWIIFNKKNNFLDFKEYSISYCNRDVLITSKFVKIIFNLIINLKINKNTVYSAPSLSFKIFLKNFNSLNVSFKYNERLDRLIRMAYYGGRCEVYGNPYANEYIFHFDFSGMYGQCMAEKFPYGKWKIIHNVDIMDKPGFYYIEYQSNCDIPVLPHHRIIDGKLIFSNGNLEGLYWYEEIKLFLENNGIINKIKYGVIFEKYDIIFDSFLKYFNNIREKGSDYKTFAKLIINSLYGRMGMAPFETYTFFDYIENLDDLNKKINIKSIKILNKIIMIEAFIDNKLKKFVNKDFIKPKNNVALAAAITSKARIKLYKAQKDVIYFNGRLLYSDTDSIFASYTQNVLGEKHGSVFWDSSKKDTLINKAVFINPKTYALIYNNGEEIVKMKGYNQKNFKYKYMEENFYNEKKISLKDYLFIRKKELILMKESVEKTFDLSNYNKRKFIENKKKTRPFFYTNYKYL